jgi:hypothetical protein
MTVSRHHTQLCSVELGPWERFAHTGLDLQRSWSPSPVPSHPACVFYLVTYCSKTWTPYKTSSQVNFVCWFLKTQRN